MQNNTTPVADSNQLAALLKVSNLIASHREFGSLLKALDVLLHEVVDFDSLVLLLYDDDKGDSWVYYPGSCKQHIKAKAFPFIHGPGFSAWKSQQTVVKSIDIYDEEYPEIADLRRGQSVQTSCTVPLTSVRRRLGALEFLSSHPNAYSPEDVRFIQLVGAQVATSVDNALVYDRVKSSEDTLANERDYLKTLLQITNVAVSKLNLTELINGVAREIHRVQGIDYCSLATYHATEDRLIWEVEWLAQGEGLIKLGRPVPKSDPVVAQCFQEARTQRAFVADILKVHNQNDVVGRIWDRGVRTLCALPLTVAEITIGVLVVGCSKAEAFSLKQVDLLEQIARQISTAVGNTMAYHEVQKLRDRLNSENLYLQEEIKLQCNFEEIIGSSPQLQMVLQQIEMVAESDSSVLILGETGTGKELIARAIHNLSPRCKNTMVKVNCASISPGLLESDLFGHERGAFTGALSRKIGRFELAHKGTIFLDEIGDMPLDIQAKFLRVLQEQEFERLGNATPIKIDARVISATNRNLQKMLDNGEFRSDLFYRLNIFPIYVPSLRERAEDIPMLVSYFLEKYARKLNRKVNAVSVENMRILKQLPWPGNVRELKHFIERAVLLSRGSVLEIPQTPSLPCSMPTESGEPSPVPTVSNGPNTLVDVERNHILQVLEETKGVVGGPNGAAARLGLKRTTLISKMKRLKIARQSRPLVFRHEA